VVTDCPAARGDQRPQAPHQRDWAFAALTRGSPAPAAHPAR